MSPKFLRSFFTLNFLSYQSRASNRAALLLFAIWISLQLALLFAFVRLCFRSTWDQHVAAGPGAITLTWLGCSVMLCFGEFFFHRYILHLETVRFLRALCTSHLDHHKRTSIRFDAAGSVRSAYPIDAVERDDQATFPPWALLPFFAFFTPFFAATAFSFPRFPIVIGGYAAIAFAHFLYEIVHVVHHQPFVPYWQRRLQSRWLGRVWRQVYGFHQAHHANYKSNLHVAGFLGLPLADLAFGTYKQPDTLLVDGAAATSASARRLTPSPRWPVSWLDRVAFKRRRWMSKRN